MKEYTFKKSTCERYDIRLKNSYGWAIITIDENGGLFNAHSDYGNYNYSWPNHGRESFKHFILELVNDKYYFLNKVSNSDYYYAEETEKAWRKEVIRARREMKLNKDQARDLWNEIINFEYNDSEAYLIHQCYENSTVLKYYSEPWYGFVVVKGFSPDANAFADIIMPIFGEIIKKEISNKHKDIIKNTNGDE